MIIKITLGIGLIVSIGFHILTTSLLEEERETNNATRQELDSIYAELDTLADIQKSMLVSYPQLSKWEAKYYAPIFREFCKTYQTPVPLALSIVGVESGWNPTLVSIAGCRGLGQLSPAAAREGCSRLGISYKEGYTEWNEIHNLTLSLYYFCSRYSRSGREFAVKSYVGGNNFRRTEAAGGKNAIYIKQYAQLVEREELKVKNILAEADKLTYIYKGILYERIIEHPEMSRAQRKMVRRVQEQNPTRTSLPVDSISKNSQVSTMLNEANNGDTLISIGR